MQTAIQQNNIGLDLLSRGAVKEATVALKHSLQALKTACNNLTDTMKLPYGTYHDTSCVHFEPHSFGDTSNQVFMIWSAPAVPSHESCSVVSALVVFNLAVALSRRQATSTMQRELCLAKQYRLLEQSLHLVQTLEEDCFSSEQREISTAVLSRMADISLQLGDAAGYRAAFDALLLLSAKAGVMSDEGEPADTIAPAA